MSFNKITIVGYLGRDPELRYTPQGTPVCKLSVATTERRKSGAGELEEHTTWFRVTVWGRQAELANEYLARGRQVYIEGRLRLEEYTDRGGNLRVSPEVSANDVQFLGQRGDNEHTDTRNSMDRIEPGAETATGPVSISTPVAKPAEETPVSKTARRAARKKALVSIEEDEIPF